MINFNKFFSNLGRKSKMEQHLYKIRCVKCKTALIIKSTFGKNCINYKLVTCPNCSTPLREICCEKELHIEKVSCE